MGFIVTDSPIKTSPNGDAVAVTALNNKANYIIQRQDATYTAATIDLGGNLEISVSSVDLFLSSTYINSMIYVSGLDDFYPLISVNPTGNTITVGSDTAPVIQTGYVINVELTHYFNLKFIDDSTSKLITEAKAITNSIGILEFDANAYIQRFEGRDHIIGVEVNHSLTYHITLSEVAGGELGSESTLPSLTVIEGRIQQGQDPNYWEHIYMSASFTDGVFLNTPGTQYIEGITTVDWAMDPSQNNSIFTDLTIDKNGAVSDQATSLDDNYLNRQHITGVGNIIPSDVLTVYLNGAAAADKWVPFLLDIPSCTEGVICRWINDRGAYNYYVFNNFSTSQETSGRTSVPVYDDEVLSYTEDTIYQTEVSYDILGADIIAVQSRTANAELMRTLLNTGTLEIKEGIYWIGYTVQDGTTPISRTNRSKFLYDFIFVKARR